MKKEKTNIPFNSHKNAAVSGPPHLKACHRKSRTGSITAHSGDVKIGRGSAQYPVVKSDGFVFLKLNFKK